MSKPELNFVHICEYASLTGDGKLNVMGIFNGINAQDLPVTHPLMYLVVNIKMPKEGGYDVIINAKKKNTDVSIYSLKLSVVANKDNSNIGIIERIEGIKFEEEGSYVFDITIDEEPLVEVPLFIRNI